MATVNLVVKKSNKMIGLSKKLNIIYNIPVILSKLLVSLFDFMYTCQ